MRIQQFSPIIFLWTILGLPFHAFAQEVSYTPSVHGVIRGKYEYQPDIDSHRFEVRNARFNFSGLVGSPSLCYKAEIDLSDEGEIKMLDAYVNYKLFDLFADSTKTKDSGRSLEFTIGQMRVPFTIDAKRSPNDQYFANRSFIGKQVGNVRDVGAMMTYRFYPEHPVILEGGFFNGSGLTNQKVWHKKLNFSTKAQFFFAKNWNLTLSAQRTKPDSVRIQTYDAGIYYQDSHWHIEGEYLYKCYADNLYNKVHAVDAFVNYDLPLKRYFKKISFLGRYDFMTDYSDGMKLSNGRLTTTDYARQRLTGGITLSLGKPFQSDIRINYEKYFYQANGIPKESEKDKFVVEFVMKF